MGRQSDTAGRRRLLRAIFVALLAVGLTAATPALVVGFEAADAPLITGTDQRGESVVRVTNETTYVWDSGTHSLTTTFVGDSGEKMYSVCAYAKTADGREEVACKSKRASANQSATVGLVVPSESLGDSGELVVELGPFTGTADPYDRKTINYTVISPDGDVDNDRLTNEEEVESEEYELNFTNADIDQDGLSDGAEVIDYGTDPTDNDTDGDGVLDGAEIQQGTNPNDPTDPPENATTTPTPTETPTAPGALPSSTTALLLFGILGVGSIGGVLIWRYSEGNSGANEVTSQNQDAPAEDGAASSEREVDGAQTAPASPPTPASPDDDLLLTDEDRVYNLIRDHGGQMKQTNIVDETEWSKSKVSRLLSRMDDGGQIHKLRVGRENIVYVEGSEPDATRSPYDEE